MKAFKKPFKHALLVAMSVAIAGLVACKPEDTPKPAAPEAPVLVSPADESTNVPLTPTLTWGAAEAKNGVKSYEVYLDTNTDPSTLLSTGTATSLTLTTPLEAGETYYWKVRVIDNKDQVATSDIFSFSTFSSSLYELSDDVFGEILVGLGYATTIEGTYYLQTNEVGSVTDLSLGGTSGTPVNVTDIDGIQFFTALRELELDYSSVRHLDLSQNANLDTLQYTNSSGNTANFLTSLSLPAGVVRVRIFRHNLPDFDASGFADLEYLRLDGDNIANAPVGGVTNVLGTLTLDENVNTKLAHLDMGGNLDAEGEPITYTVNQTIFDRLTSELNGNKDGVALPASFEIATVEPVDDAVGVGVDAAITVTFSSDLDESTLNYALKAGASTISTTSDVAGAVLTITPDNNLAFGTEYTLEITAATGTNGASLEGTATYTFTTLAAGDVSVDQVVSSSRTLSSTTLVGQVNRTGTIVLTFSADVENTFGAGSYTLQAGGNAVASSFEATGATVTITPNAALDARTEYVLTLLSANPIADNGGSLTADVAYNFRTAFFSAGDGSEAYPYEIDEPAELDSVRLHLSAHFEMTGNVNLESYLSGSGWTPIGISEVVPFSGSFDGQFHQVQNLWSTLGTDYIGLFGSLSGASLSGIGVTIHSNGLLGAEYVGGLAGEMRNNSTISQCYVTGEGIVASTVNGTASRLGGFIGYITSGSISESFSTVDVGGTALAGSNIASRVGGFVGGVGASLGGVSNCYSTGSVNGAADTGGFVGWASGSVDFSTISSVYSSGNVTTTDATTSGIFGGNDLDTRTVTTCYYNTDANLDGGNAGISITGLTGVSFSANGGNSGSFPGLSTSVWTFGQSGVSGSNGPVLSWEIQ